MTSRFRPLFTSAIATRMMPPVFGPWRSRNERRLTSRLVWRNWAANGAPWPLASR